MTSPGPLRIGPVEARVEAEAVARYRDATAIDDAGVGGEEVPATFPAVWLWHPAARAAFDDLTGGDHVIPVLIAQRFCYRRALGIGDEVRFFVTRKIDPGTPDDVHIEAHIEDIAGVMIADFSATYRLFSAEAAR